MIISTRIVPNGGWQYQQNFTTIKADTFDDLIKNVTDHRQSNGLPTGDVEEDIHKQLGRLYPKLVVEK